MDAHGPADLLLELGAIILGLAILARIARKIGISPIPFYVLAGLAFGRGGFLPLPASTTFVEGAADVGAVLLLLMLGLEFTPGDFVSSLRASAPAGVIDFVMNFTPGVAAGLLFGWSVLPAVYLGGITLMTSSGVMSKVIRDLGRVSYPDTRVVLSIAILEDLVMAVYLPVVSGLTTAGTPLAGILAVGGSAVIVALILLVALRYGNQLSRVALSPSDEVLLLTVLGATLIVAGFAERFQISAAVGAFLVGIGLGGDAAHRAPRLLSPLRDLFAAAFFLFFGLEIDPESIPPVLGAAAGLALVTGATKIATGWWSAARARIDRAGRIRAGATLIARGEFSIVIAGLAASAGLEPRLAPLAAAYVMLLATAGPIAAKVAGAAFVSRRNAHEKALGRHGERKP